MGSYRSFQVSSFSRSSASTGADRFWRSLSLSSPEASFACLSTAYSARTHAIASRDLGRRLFRIDDLAAQVRPASGAHDAVAGYHAVIAAVAIGQQNLVVTLQKILRTVPAAAQRKVEDVVGMRRVAHVDPHPRLGAFLFAEHRQDGVIGRHHVRRYLLGPRRQPSRLRRA